jgi:methanogenic corrinoid protein MtbC1
MYTIKHAADLTGVPMATLRAWERRYGVIAPQRTAAGYRLYDDRSLKVIAAVRDLVQDGWSPKQAAGEVERRMAAASAGETGQGIGPESEPPGIRSPSLAQDRGAGEYPATGLIEAASDLDAVRLAEFLDDRFSRGSFETVVGGWLMPALRELGEAWAEGRISVAGEHLVSNAIERRLATAFEAAARNPDGPRVVIGLPPGARHELGILAFATAARRVGLAVTYLGADLPAEDWAGAVARHSASCAVLALPRDQDVAGLIAVLEAIGRTRVGVQVAVGGRYQHLAPDTVERLGHDIPTAATRLAAVLAAVR